MFLKALKFETISGYHVEIPLWFANTALTGDGGTGKTYVFNAIRQLQQRGKFAHKVFLVNETNWYDCQHIVSMKDTLIIIDNWEVVALKYPKIKDILNTDSVQSLIIGRDFDGVRLHREHVYVLETDEQKKEIKAKPVLHRGL